MANTNQKEIHIIIGAPLTGKTSYIKKNYQDKEKFYVINYADKFLELFGEFEEEEDTDKVCDVYNTIAPELADDFQFGDKTLVIEYCTGFEEADKDLAILINKMKKLNCKIKIKDIKKGLEASKKLQEAAKQDPTYFSSYHLNDYHFTVLTNFFDDMKMTENLGLDN